jgi:hypothetical protein
MKRSNKIIYIYIYIYIYGKKIHAHPNAYSHKTCVQNRFTCNHQYTESFNYACDSKLNHVNCHNPSFGLVTKARGCKVAGQEEDPGALHMLLRVQRVRGHEPSHSQVNSHVAMLGVRVPKGLPDFQNAIVGVKTPCLKEFFISLKSYWSVDV